MSISSFPDLLKVLIFKDALCCHIVTRSDTRFLIIELSSRLLLVTKYFVEVFLQKEPVHNHVLSGVIFS